MNQLRKPRRNVLEQLKFRLVRSAKVQEGDEPSENSKRLLDELEQCARRTGKRVTFSKEARDRS